MYSNTTTSTSAWDSIGLPIQDPRCILEEGHETDHELETGEITHKCRGTECWCYMGEGFVRCKLIQQHIMVWIEPDTILKPKL